MRGYHLAGLSNTAKLVYSIFLGFIVLGMWSSIEIYDQRIGSELQGAPGSTSVRGRYLDHQTPGAGAAADGPTMELPPEEGLAGEDEGAASAGKWAWILDVFHQHVFSISVVWLVLAHLFMLTRLHPMISGVVILLSGLASMSHVLAPLIIHQLDTGAWLMPVSGIAMALTWLVMVAWTFMAMWFGLGRPVAPDAMSGPR